MHVKQLTTFHLSENFCDKTQSTLETLTKKFPKITKKSKGPDNLYRKDYKRQSQQNYKVVPAWQKVHGKSVSRLTALS